VKLFAERAQWPAVRAAMLPRPGRWDVVAGLRATVAAGMTRPCTGMTSFWPVKMVLLVRPLAILMSSTETPKRNASTYSVSPLCTT